MILLFFLVIIICMNKLKMRNIFRKGNVLKLIKLYESPSIS